MKKIFIVLAAVACIFTSCNSTKTQAQDKPLVQNEKIVHGEFDNGMNYYILHNTEPQNRIFMRLVVRAGSAMETDSERGVAHFVEHMCFNGTEHFAENSLVDYAESIGMAFGPEVNAYTSFEETVYMFEVPADKPEYFEQALLIFKDWANAVTFDPVELDKERGVILEEWRGKQGFNFRLTNELLKFELKDSGFIDRLPIGSMDVVQNISRDDVKAFYDKWYRPENMSVVISGAIDPKVASYKLEQTMSEIPASKERIEPPVFSVPLRKDKDILLIKDKEMPYVQMQFFQQQDIYTGRSTFLEYKKVIAESLLNTVMNMRFEEITQKADSPWLVAQIHNFRETNHSYFTGMIIVPKDGMVTQAMKTLFDEYDRFLLHGATETELQRAKDQFMASEEQWYEQRLGINSDDRCQTIINQILLGKTAMSDDDIFQASKESIASISLADLTQVLRENLPNRGTLCSIYAPETAELPSNKEIMDVWKNYKGEELAKYTDDTVIETLMARPSEKAAVAQKNTIKELEANEYILSNGIKIITKKTNYDKNQILFKAVRKGGLAKHTEAENLSCRYGPMYALYSGIADVSVTQFIKWLSDKRINLTINEELYSEYISATSSNEDLEKMLQIAYLFMQEPKFTDDGWNQVALAAEYTSKSYGLQPVDFFNEKIRDVMVGGSAYFSPVTPELVKQLDRADCERFYKERFCNPLDFTFTFVGDFNEAELIEMCCYYLGSMKGDESIKDEISPITVDYPTKAVKEIVNKGQDEKGHVYISFTGKLPATDDVEQKWKENEMVEQVRQLLEIKLREVIREDKSGTYGVSVVSAICEYQDRIYQFEIFFGCEPERQDELTAEVIAAINSLKQNVAVLDIQKLNETYRRNFELNLRSNDWWQRIIINSYIMNYLPVNAASDNTSVIKWTTEESIKQLLNKYFDENNYVTIYLKPEK